MDDTPMDDFFVIYFLDEPDPHVVRYAAPHITFLGFLQIPTHDEAGRTILAAGVKEIAESTPAFTMLLGEREWFGSEHNVPVILSYNQEGAEHQLHQRFHEHATSNSFRLLQPHYAGENFKPHITLDENEGAGIPFSFLVSSVTLMRNKGGLGSGEVEWLGTYQLGAALS